MASSAWNDPTLKQERGSEIGKWGPDLKPEMWEISAFHQRYEVKDGVGNIQRMSTGASGPKRSDLFRL